MVGGAWRADQTVTDMFGLLFVILLFRTFNVTQHLVALVRPCSVDVRSTLPSTRMTLVAVYGMLRHVAGRSRFPENADITLGLGTTNIPCDLKHSLAPLPASTIGSSTQAFDSSTLFRNPSVLRCPSPLSECSKSCRRVVNKMIWTYITDTLTS